MKNRWLIALAAVGIHISIGSIYAYSVLKNPLMFEFGWNTSIAFSIAIVFLGLSAAFMGHFVEKYGPRRAGTLAALFYGCGVLGSGLACSLAQNNATKVSQQPISHYQDLLLTPTTTDLDQINQAARQHLQNTLARLPSDATVGDTLQELTQQVTHANEAINHATTTERITAITNAKTLRQAQSITIAATIAPSTMSSLWLFYFFYGVMGGIGLGVGYISPVSTLVKWFPDRRGLATGLAIMGFGFAAMIFGPAMKWLMGSTDIATMFYILGGIYLIVMLSSAQYLAPPPTGWIPNGFQAKTQSGNQATRTDLSQLTANEAITTKRFYYLWFMLFINVTCGIAVISVAAPMAIEQVGMSATEAALMVGLMGLFNGAGRIAWASFSDIVGRANIYVCFFALQIAAFFVLPSISNIILFQIVMFVILSCYGGGFASVPAFIGDLFGTKQLGAIHGYILTAWAAAGLVGPQLASYVRSTTNDFNLTLYIFSGFFVLALIVSGLMKANINQLCRK